MEGFKAGAKNYLLYPINPSEVRLALKSINKSLELNYMRDLFWKGEWLDIIDSRSGLVLDVIKKIRIYYLIILNFVTAMMRISPSILSLPVTSTFRLM